MAKLQYVLLGFIFILSSCGSRSSDNKSENKDTLEIKNAVQEVLQEKNATPKSEFKSCDEFLDAFDKWMDEYLDILEDYYKNRTNPVTAKRYMETAQKMQEWSTQWLNIYSCAMDKKYQKRFKEISEKADKRMKEIGLKK